MRKQISGVDDGWRIPNELWTRSDAPLGPTILAAHSASGRRSRGSLEPAQRMTATCGATLVFSSDCGRRRCTSTMLSRA